MTFWLTCDCPDPTSDCGLEEVIKGVLELAPGLAGCQVFTGDLASGADTGNQGPTIPYCVLSDLGANNSSMYGENLVHHEVLVRFRFYTTTDKAGLALARAAVAAVGAGQLETVDGYACRSRVPARARPLKLGNGRWMTQVNQLFYIHYAV